MEKIGFIGLGHMGAPMASNLVKKGYTVKVYDINAQVMAAVADEGAIAATDLADLSKDVDVIITMLQTGQQVKQVCLSHGGLFKQARANTTFIDCSSIDIKMSRSLHKKAIEHGHQMLDAPVSGGAVGAKGGTLTFMVGGEQQTFEAMQPILQAMGQQVNFVGHAGNGQAAKICNNMILGISMIAVSEAFVLAEKLGLSEKDFFNISSHASGSCWSMTHYSPVPNLVDNVPSNNDYKPGFTAQMMLKDLCLSQDAARSVSAFTPLGSKATELYHHFVNQDYHDIDFSAIIKMIGGKLG